MRKKNQQTAEDVALKNTLSPIAYNRRKFDNYIAKTNPKNELINLPDEIPADEIIHYVNMARTEPKKFADLLRSKLKFYKNDKLFQSPYTLITCGQGKKALQEAIRFCENQKPIGALAPNDSLMLTAMDHCMDQISGEYLGHSGTDGSHLSGRILRRGYFTGGAGQNCDHVMWFESKNYAEQTVIRLIVDQGVPSRGHRQNIYNPQYKFIGVCMLKNPKTGYKHAMNLTYGNVQLENTECSQKNFKYKKISAPIQEKKQQVEEFNEDQKFPEQIEEKKNQKKRQNKKKADENLSPIQILVNQIDSSYPPISKDASSFMRNAREFVRKIRRKFNLYVATTVPEDKVADIPDFIPAEQMFQVLNQARTNPKEFAKVVRSRMKQFIDDKHRKTSLGTILYNEGKSAYQEAIQFLEQQKPEQAFQLNQCLNMVAADHCIDMIGGNFFSNRSSDGASLPTKIKKRYGDKFIGFAAQNWDMIDWRMGPRYAEETIVRYLVSERIPNRVYRTNIFSKNFKFVGIAMLKDPKVGFKCNMVLTAQNYGISNNDASSRQYLYYGSPTLMKALKEQNSNKNLQKQQLNKDSDEVKQFINETIQKKQKQNPEQLQQKKESPIISPPKKTNKIDSDAEYNKLRDQQDKQFDKMWDVINSNNNTMNLKSQNNILKSNNYDDIFSKNISLGFGNEDKQIQQTYTRAKNIKNITVNGLKKTEVTKVTIYTDGSTETRTKVI